VSDPLVLLHERYVLNPKAGADPGVDDPALHYGVIDTMTGKHAILPNAVLCWGLPYDEALDALIELRGGRRADSLRDSD
jgi:hypothetical protein